MRVFRCPWCGEVSIHFSGKFSEGSRRHKYLRCGSCSQQFGLTNGFSNLQQVAYFLIVTVLGAGALILLAINGLDTGAGFLILFLILFALIAGIWGMYIYNYFHTRLVRIQHDQYVPFTYQGLMEITPADEKAAKLIREGEILAIRYAHRKAETEADTIFPIVLSRSPRDDRPAIWQWGFLKPQFAPQALLREGQEVVIIDTGPQIASGRITAVFDEYRNE